MLRGISKRRELVNLTGFSSPYEALNALKYSRVFREDTS